MSFCPLLPWFLRMKPVETYTVCRIPIFFICALDGLVWMKQQSLGNCLSPFRMMLVVRNCFFMTEYTGQCRTHACVCPDIPHSFIRLLSKLYRIWKSVNHILFRRASDMYRYLLLVSMCRGKIKFLLLRTFKTFCMHDHFSSELFYMTLDI